MLIVDCTMQKECKNGRGMHVWHDISFGENPLRLKKHQVSPKSFGLIMLMLKGKHHKKRSGCGRESDSSIYSPVAERNPPGLHFK